MVAAGGGGAEDWAGQSYGGAAGGLYSYDVPYYASGSWGYTLNTGATQTEGGKGMYGYNQSGKQEPLVQVAKAVLHHMVEQAAAATTEAAAAAMAAQ